MENTTLWEIFLGLLIWLGSILIVGYALESGKIIPHSQNYNTPSNDLDLEENKIP